jgi:DNA-binding winged helix-turn-helix (wHTH) protein/tetratricopeptide (TPR) repeat protein
MGMVSRDDPTIGRTGAPGQWAAHDAKMTRYDAGLSACMLGAGRLEQTHPTVDVPADIHFDCWTFRRQPRGLSRDGVRVRLQDQPLHVLEELLNAPGELVTREHLIARLWPKRIVEFDAALNAAVRRLRATLGDEAETPRYIETVPRQGYRFIGAVRAWRETPTVAVVVEPAIASLTPAPPASSPFPQRASRMMRTGIAGAVAAIVVGVVFAAAWTWHAHASRPGGAETVLSSEAMERAKFFAQRRHPGDLERATKEYERALSLAPNLARAWAGLASVHWFEIGEGLQPREVNLPKVRDAALRALSLDPQLVEAHIRLATYLCATGQRAAAVEHYEKAVALEPDNPLVLATLAGLTADEGRWDEAIAFQRRAVAAEPLSLAAAENLAYFLFLAGRTEDAKKQFAKVLELDPTQPNEIDAFAEILEGRYEQALRIVETWPAGETRDHSLALIYHGLGRDEEARERLESLKAAKTWGNSIRVAEVYAHRGEIEEAFRWLQSPDSNSPQDSAPSQYASPFLKPLHQDARWANVVRVAQAGPH